MLLQQLLAPFNPGGAAAVKRRASVIRARDDLIALVGGGDRPRNLDAAARRRADAAVAALAEKAAQGGECLLDLASLGPDPYEVVYASGGFPLWRATAEIAEKLSPKRASKEEEKEKKKKCGAAGAAAAPPPRPSVVASQQFDPSTRRLLNRVSYGAPFFGVEIAVSAFGQYTPLEDPPLYPASVRADVEGGRIEFRRRAAAQEGGDGDGGGAQFDLPFIRGQGLFEVLYADEEIRVFRSRGPGDSAAISVQMPRRSEAGRQQRARRRR